MRVVLPDDPARSRCGPGADRVLLDQNDPDSGRSQLIGDHRAVDSSTDDDDGMHEDVEEAYEEVDQEEQTAVQVLAEANALCVKIMKIVSGWCGGGNKVKGLIMGEDGALNLSGVGDKGMQVVAGKDDEMWISNETMKAILPDVKLAEYQLLGVNWLALLNRTVFGNGKGRKGMMNVNGILADEMG